MGTFVEVNKTFNQHGCIQFLDEEVLSFSYLLCENPLMDKLSFQYDNCRVFQVKIVTDWFDEHSKELYHIS